MKYTKSALGLLNAQYRSVLKKCLLINLGLFALGAVAATPANAADYNVVAGVSSTESWDAGDTIGTVSVSTAISDVTGLQDALDDKADAATTLSGYGITDAYTKTEVNTALGGKQNALSEAQLNAANSGITADKVSTYDGYATTIAGKQNALSEAQLNAVNSGITSDKVSQIATNTSNISTNTSNISTNTSNINTLTTTVAGHTTSISDLQTAVAGKQATLSEAQLNAVNSGITAAGVTKLNGIAEGAQVNTIEIVKVNGSALTPDTDKAVDITVAEGATNGTIAVNGADVAVHGLGTAAYAATTDFDAAGTAAGLIAALDASESQTAGTDGLALSITQTDGVITAISGSIAANTYDAYGAADAVKEAIENKLTAGATGYEIYVKSIETSGDATIGGKISATNNITTSEGNIIASTGNIIASAGNITATAGNITASAGSVTAGNGVTATAGNIIASAGDIKATAGDVIADAGKVSGKTLQNANETFTVDQNGNLEVTKSTDEYVQLNADGSMAASGTATFGADDSQVILDKGVVTADKGLVVNEGGADITAGGNSLALDETDGLAITADTDITGDLSVVAGDGDTEFYVDKYGIELYGDTYIESGDNYISVSADDGVEITGDTSIDGDLTANGTSTFTKIGDTDDYVLTVETDGEDGHVAINGGLEVSNGLAVDAGDTSLDVTADGVAIAGDTSIDGKLAVSGDTKIGDKFSVTATDGSFSAADGKFAVNENGAIAAADNKFVVNKDGNITKAGTISATNGKFTVKDGGVVSAAAGTFQVKEGGAVSAAAGTFQVKEGGLVSAADGTFQIKEGGTVSAADGKLEIKEGGAVSAAAGNFLINTDGSFGLDNQTFTVDKDGNANAQTLTSQGDLGVHGTSWLKDTNVDGALAVTGTSWLKDTVVDGALAVSGDSTVGQNFAVAGTSYLHNTSVTGDMAVSGTTKTGALTFDGEAYVAAIDQGEEAITDGVLEGRYTTMATAATVAKTVGNLEGLVADAEDAEADPIGITSANDVADTIKSLATNVEAATGGEFAADGTWSAQVNSALAEEAAADYAYSTKAANVMQAINQVAANVGTTDDFTNDFNGVGADNTVNQNIDTLNGTIGNMEDLGTDLKNLTAGGDEAPTTVVEALNNLDSSFGDRQNMESANTQINEASKESVAAGLTAAGDAIGNMDFGSAHYYTAAADDGANLTDAVKTLDTNLYRVDRDLSKLKRQFNSGMASMAAMSALVPNSRSQGNTSISLGTGAYNGNTAMALGGFHYITDNVLLNAGAAWGNSHDMSYRLGITWSF